MTGPGLGTCLSHQAFAVDESTVDRTSGSYLVEESTGGAGGFAVQEMIPFCLSPLPSSARPSLAPLLPEEVRRDGRFGDQKFLHSFAGPAAKRKRATVTPGAARQMARSLARLLGRSELKSPAC